MPVGGEQIPIFMCKWWDM